MATLGAGQLEAGWGYSGEQPQAEQTTQTHSLKPEVSRTAEIFENTFNIKKISFVFSKVGNFFYIFLFFKIFLWFFSGVYIIQKFIFLPPPSRLSYPYPPFFPVWYFSPQVQWKFPLFPLFSTPYPLYSCFFLNKSS